MVQFYLNIKSVWIAFERSYYTMPFMIILNILFIAIALNQNKLKKKYSILIIYGICTLIQDVIGISVILSSSQTISSSLYRLNETSITALMFIEFVAFYSFFYIALAQKLREKKIVYKLKAYLFTSAGLMLLSALFTSLSKFLLFQGYYSVLMSLLILIPSFYYFYTLFIDPPIKNLIAESEFWIITGITCLHCLNIPIFAIDYYVAPRMGNAEWYSTYSISYMAYCLLFVLFIIGFLCSKGKSKYQTNKLFSIFKR